MAGRQHIAEGLHAQEADGRFQLAKAPHARSQRIGSSFYLEVLILVAVILFMALVLTAVLANARGTALEAQRTTDAALLSSDVAEMYAAAATDADFADLLAAHMEDVDASGVLDATGTSGQPQVVAWRDGATVTACLSAQATDAGVLHTAAITVTYDGTVYGEISAQRYESGRGGAS